MQQLFKEIEVVSRYEEYVIYRAQNIQMNKRYIIKRLRTPTLGQSEVLQNEALLTQTLPSYMCLHYTYVDNETPYLTTRDVPYITMKLLAEQSVLEERNRIAREIHDVIGHTLTTALVQMEASKRLFQQGTSLTEALDKLHMSQQLLSKGS
jgi:signal transduction histidine kinase